MAKQVASEATVEALARVGLGKGGKPAAGRFPPASEAKKKKSEGSK